MQSASVAPQEELDADQRPVAWGAAELERPAQGLYPVAEADEARAAGGIGTVCGVVANLQVQAVATLEMDGTNIVGLLNECEARQLIEWRRSPEDRRRRRGTAREGRVRAVSGRGRGAWRARRNPARDALQPASAGGRRHHGELHCSHRRLGNPARRAREQELREPAHAARAELAGLDDGVVWPRGRAPIDQLRAVGRASAFQLQSDPNDGYAHSPTRAPPLTYTYTVSGSASRRAGRPRRQAAR